MGYIISKYNQSIWDIALQEYGDSAGVEILIKDNPDKLNFADAIPTRTKILISQPPINKTIVDYLKSVGAVMATAVLVRNWILATSYWDDGGEWYDSMRWVDGGTVILSNPPPLSE